MPLFYDNAAESINANAKDRSEGVCNKIRNVKGAYCKNKLAQLQSKAECRPEKDGLFGRSGKHPEIKPKGNEYDNIQYNFPQMKPSHVLGIVEGNEIKPPLSRKKGNVRKGKGRLKHNDPYQHKADNGKYYFC